MNGDHTDTLLAYRQQFPILAERTYLASQCVGPFPRAAHADIEDYLRTRHLHNRALGEWFTRIGECARLIERLLDAPAGSIALRDNATASQAAVLASVSPFPAKNRIVVTELDFHSSLHLYSAQRRRGFDLHVVRSRDGMRIHADDVVAAIDDRTAFVSVSLVSRYNAMLDIVPVITRAREVGAIVVVDAYQAVGVVPLDVTNLQVDVLVAGTHKWLSGETGLAFLYVRPELAERLNPVYPGWFGHQDLDGFVHVHAFDDVYRPMPGARRFQQGTPSMLSIYGSLAGLRFVLAAGVERIRQRNVELTECLMQGAADLGLDVMTPRASEQRAGGMCVKVPNPEQVVNRLAMLGIDVDQRRNTVIRVAPHACTTNDECDHFLHELARVLDEA